MTKESIEKERYTIEEIDERLNEFEADQASTPKPTNNINEALGEDDEPFDPHNFDTTNLE